MNTATFARLLEWHNENRVERTFSIEALHDNLILRLSDGTQTWNQTLSIDAIRYAKYDLLDREIDRMILTLKEFHQ